MNEQFLRPMLDSTGDGPAAAASPGDSQPSERARFVAEMIPYLPERTVADLERLLQRRLNAFDSRTVRYERLGLLIQTVSTGTGEVPATREYEAEREERKKLGEDWPVHSTIITAYGGWVRGVRAAMLLWRDGSSSRTASSNHHYGDRPDYTHEEAVRAFLACHQTLGVWPTEYEYDEWRLLARELARNAGRPEPRLPSRGAWENLFGDWAAFERRARHEANVAPVDQRRDAESEPGTGGDQKR